MTELARLAASIAIGIILLGLLILLLDTVQQIWPS